MDDRDSVLARGGALWERLQRALDASLESPLGPNSDWTGHDVYAHLARWTRQSIDDTRRLLASEQPQPVPGSEDEINARWHEEDRALTTDVVRARCLDTRDEFRALLTALTPDQWARLGLAVSDDVNGNHYAEHLAAIGQAAV
jgi:hypothetical protein